jgi:hypothetical protein
MVDLEALLEKHGLISREDDVCGRDRNAIVAPEQRARQRRCQLADPSRHPRQHLPSHAVISRTRVLSFEMQVGAAQLAASK